VSKPAAEIGCVLLAGGLARRMGGRDKGLIPLGTKPMVQWVLAAVQPQVNTVLINANRHHDRYAQFGVAVAEDCMPGHLGPLAGLLTGLRRLNQAYVFMCPCDSPLVPGTMVQRLYNGLRDAAADIAVAHDGTRMQPVFCLVKQSMSESLSRFLQSGERKIDRWYSLENTVTVDFSDYLDAFNNINTEEERLEMERRLNLDPAK